MSKRVASHSGSWYSDNRAELDRQLTKWLNAVNPTSELMPSRGIIAPHAGYSYSGPTAAHAYRHLDPSRVTRIFVLGPSHHYYLTGGAVTAHKFYSTPLGDLEVDQKVNQELLATGQFEKMSRDVDEEEHSLEMHMPYIYKMMERAKHAYTVVPIMVGSLSPEKEAYFGQLFAKYLADPQNFFVISSDFCHWGQRFRYTYYDPSAGEIHQSIERLDKEGMAAIETLNPATYHKYQEQFKNTICGRHAIAIFMHAISLDSRSRGVSGKYALRFVQYAQSSACRSKQDSSVSYASAVLRDAVAA